MAGIYGAVAYDPDPGGYSGAVRIARYDQGRWSTVTTLPLFGFSLGQAYTPLRAARLTGSAFPEFAIEEDLGTTQGFQEVTAAGGHWRFLKFLGGETDFAGRTVVGHYVGNATAGKQLAMRWQDCLPSCADGGLHTNVYEYGPRSHELVAVG